MRGKRARPRCACGTYATSTEGKEISAEIVVVGGKN